MDSRLYVLTEEDKKAFGGLSARHAPNVIACGPWVRRDEDKFPKRAILFLSEHAEGYFVAEQFVVGGFDYFSNENEWSFDNLDDAIKYLCLRIRAALGLGFF